MGRAPHLHPTPAQIKVENHPANVWLIVGFVIIQLDEEERLHLIRLLQDAAPTGPTPRRTTPEDLPV